MVKEKKEKYKTIRIYADDHEKLIKKYNKNLNFADVVRELVNNGN